MNKLATSLHLLDPMTEDEGDNLEIDEHKIFNKFVVVNSQLPHQKGWPIIIRLQVSHMMRYTPSWITKG